MSELLNNIRSRIESLGIGFQFVKTIKTGTDGAEHGFWNMRVPSLFLYPAGKMSL